MADYSANYSNGDLPDVGTEQVSGTVASNVREFVDHLVKLGAVNANNKALCALAIRLAQNMDTCTSFTAVPNIARELRATLNGLIPQKVQSDDFESAIAGVLSAMGDPALTES